MSPLLGKIEDEHVRSLVAAMIQRDPKDRRSAGEYLRAYEGKVFPPYFRGFLHGFLAQLMKMSSDDKIEIVRKSYDDICRVVVGSDVADDELARKYREMSRGPADSADGGAVARAWTYSAGTTATPLSPAYGARAVTASSTAGKASDEGGLVMVLIAVCSAVRGNIQFAASKRRALQIVLQAY